MPRNEEIIKNCFRILYVFKCDAENKTYQNEIKYHYLTKQGYGIGDKIAKDISCTYSKCPLIYISWSSIFITENMMNLKPWDPDLGKLK